MGFFDFLQGMRAYQDRAQAGPRMNRRHDFLIKDFAKDITDARVLDLGAHDGRWAYAFAGAGAAEVVGIEARADAVAGFTAYPDAALRARVTLRVDDVFEGLEKAVAAGETYDIVAIFGLFYHIMDQFRLLRLIRKLGPRLIIIDGEFSQRPKPVLVLDTERSDNPMNAIAQSDGQQMALVAIPSFAAMELMAEALDYNLIWSDWASLPDNKRRGVQDYFRPQGQGKKRATCALRPRAG
ncbi:MULTISPECIES: class I SAM-dependent methyltransferase [unclassified Yoonia]|uniref:class I SAM-dependent methyltransferase n=1 Tax=unclassified Yoonia TaxID=2629118 RepID=UPI002AFF128F|nr:MULTISPECIES: class I SAM-dependent methyltransferase [unclassified Yoonia]